MLTRQRSLAWPPVDAYFLPGVTTPRVVDAQLDAIFLAEAERRLAEVERILDGDFPHVGTPELTTLQRHAHSLKGVAGSVGHPVIEALARDVWTAIDAEVHGQIPAAVAENEIRREFRMLRDEVARIQAEHASQP